MPVLQIAIAGLASLGIMTVVNFVIGSQFRSLIASLGVLWAISVFLEVPTALASRPRDR